MGYAFISYSSKQRRDALRLRALLRENGIDTWMAPDDLPEGAEYADVVGSVIRDAACMVLLLTEDSQNSVYVDKEIERALHYGKTIAPIQLSPLTLSDSFSFYLCNQQIVRLSAVDETTPKMQTLLGQLQLLCNERLPRKDDALDAARDKRVRRKKAARLLGILGWLLPAAALVCGWQYVDMCGRVTILEMYRLEDVPGIREIGRWYGAFFAMAALGAFMILYGAGLGRAGLKSRNPLRVIPGRMIPAAVSVVCGAGAGLLAMARRAVETIVTGLTRYGEPVEAYVVPGWWGPLMWIGAALCAGTAILWLILRRKGGK